MKRLMLMILCLCMAVSLAACGSRAPASVDTPTAPTGAPDTPTTPTETATQAPEADYSLSDLVLANNESCAFTVTGMEFNEHLGLQVHVLCENKSDRPLMFSWNNTAVCGFMYEPLWAEEVAAGKKVNSTVDIDTYALERIGIASVDEITFTLQVSDSEEFMNEPVVNEEFTIYPTGKPADQVVYPQYRHKEGEAVIVQNEDITFIIENVDDELADYYTLNCYISNNTDQNLMVSWEDVSVNGFMVNPFWAASVAAGKQAYSEIIFFRSDLDAQDIEVVQEIEFKLQVYDYDDWEADYLLDEVFTFKPIH